ncbi:CD48 antigen-like [Danio aesculapii]|uniref:CD48 antigen-like n=1 Tax=Danio aesculapii TaxID=1142201 RepID=UPI0024C06E45|nr:CD48 antigen-like [Danio aesculapii]
MHLILWIFIVFVIKVLVTAEADELETVLEGDVFTLQTRGMDLESIREVTWLFQKGDKTVRIAQMYQGHEPFYERKSTGRVKMDPKTGSLTIQNISISDSGLYEVTIKTRSVSKKRFRVDVYEAVSVPVITSLDDVNQTQGTLKQPQELCSVLCSVKNSRDVLISWYKGGEMIKQSSSPELNISLSLSLELHYGDAESYRCTAHNPVSNKSIQMQIRDVCRSTPEDSQDHCGAIEAQIRLVLSALVGIATIVFLLEHLRY